jgi:hypothetical protein
MRFAFACFLAAFFASPALAFTPPNGCTPKLTVQLRSCLLLNIWTCEGDAPGHQWIAMFNTDGPSRVRRVDAEFQWLETFVLNPIRTDRMITPAADPENLTELFATGQDLYDFTIMLGDGVARRYVGYDRLTGEQTVIDGEVLENTEYAYDVFDGNGTLVDSREGRQFVSMPERIFLFGRSWQQSNPEIVSDATPVEFIRTGEPGFFPNKPIYDCGAMMSSFEAETLPANLKGEL